MRSSLSCNNSYAHAARICRLIRSSLLEPQSEIPTQGILVCSLGKPKSRHFKSTCPTCKLFLKVAPRYNGQYSLALRLHGRFPRYRSSKDRLAQGRDGFETHDDDDFRTMFLTVIRDHKRLTYDHAFGDEIGPQGLLIPKVAKGARSPRSVVPFIGQYDFITEFIQTCMSDHIGLCQYMTREESTLKLLAIDCFRCTVVTLESAQKYVALSYVWGDFEDSVPLVIEDRYVLDETNLPLTIRDAIHVVRKTGFQYLWIDRYCISQSNDVQKREAIMNMDQIYANAEFTIVAMYGNNIHAGLPGVSKVRRDVTQHGFIKEARLVSTLPPLESVIDDSTWSTRGWTYQEGRLSRRCVFFTEYQVYCACQRLSCSEAVPEGSLIANDPRSKGLNALSFSANKKTSNAAGLFLDRSIYTAKMLSHQNDALDAFRGILKTYPLITFWGIPVACRNCHVDPCVAFAIGLLWIRRPSWSLRRHLRELTDYSYRRRLGFPTWSWTSVVGEIYQDSYGDQSFYQKFLNATASLIQKSSTVASLRIKMPNTMSLAQAIASTKTNILSEDSRSIRVEGELVKVTTKDKVVFHFCSEDREPIQEYPILPTFDVDDHSRGWNTYKHGELQLQDALVLIEWNDDQHRAQTRFVLMLLYWVDDGIAERVGLLGEYRKTWEVRFVKSLKRQRVEFELR